MEKASATGRYSRLVTIIGLAIGLLAVFAGPAGAATTQGNVWRQAGTADAPKLVTKTLTNTKGGVKTVVRLYNKVDKDHQAAYVVVTSGSRGVQVQAQCARRNGGTAWYTSTIVVHAGQGESHFDCDNNGTYNYKLVGMGVSFVQ
jgi:hypothetical protein